MIDRLFTPEELKMIEARWKSDVDFKLDALLEFNEKYAATMQLLLEREQRRAALQKAIIEKSLSGLIYAMLAGLIALAWAGIKVGAREFVDATQHLRK